MTTFSKKVYNFDGKKGQNQWQSIGNDTHLADTPMIDDRYILCDFEMNKQW